MWSHCYKLLGLFPTASPAMSQCGLDVRPPKKIEIQKQAVHHAWMADLDEEMFGVAAPAVGGPWQRQLNELGGVKPLAFGQYGELGTGFEQLLDQLAEEGTDEAPARRCTCSSPTAKSQPELGTNTVSLRAPNRPLSGSVAFLGHLGLNTPFRNPRGARPRTHSTGLANEPARTLLACLPALVPLAGFCFWGGTRAGFSTNRRG
jgi:hypothetical protein